MQNKHVRVDSFQLQIVQTWGVTRLLILVTRLLVTKLPKLVTRLLVTNTGYWLLILVTRLLVTNTGY